MRTRGRGGFTFKALQADLNGPVTLFYFSVWGANVNTGNLAHRYVALRARKSLDAHGYASFYPVDQCIQQEAGESHAVSFYFIVYNFVKIHKSIKTTPAMEVVVTTYLWSMEDIAMMTETSV